MIRNQKGLTAITWVIVIAFLAVQAVMAMRIIPVYINYGSVKSIMDGLPNDPVIKGKSPKEIQQIIRKRLSINSIYSFDKGENKNAFKFVKASNGVKIKVQYEERGPIFSNLEFVATFKHEVFLPK